MSSCGCSGTGVDVTLCRWHAEIFARRHRRLLEAGDTICKMLTKEGNGTHPQIQELAEALRAGGADFFDTPEEEARTKKHFLLRRAYDSLRAAARELVPLPKRVPAGSRRDALRAWHVQAHVLLEELHKVFDG